MATKKTPAPKGIKALTGAFAVRAKAAQDKAAGRRAELVKFNNDNFAATKASVKTVRAGVKPLVELAAGNARNQVQAFRASVQSLKGVKSPVELFKLQAEANKAALAAAREDTRAFGEAVAKLAGEASAPLKARFAEVRKLAA